MEPDFSKPPVQIEAVYARYKRNRGDLCQNNFYGLQASDISLAKAILTESNLCFANFNQVDWTQARFYGTLLAGVHFKNSNLSGAVFFRADLTKAVFEECNFAGAKFVSCVMDEAVFIFSDKEKAHFQGVDFSNSSLKGAKLAGYNLSMANFGACDFEKADLSHCGIHKSNFRNARFSEAKMSETFSAECYFRDAIFELTDLTLSIFVLCKCLGTRFESVTAKTVKFWGCIIDSAIFNDSFFENVEFNANYLVNTTFTQSHLAYAKYEDNAPFRNILFSECQLFDSIFQNQSFEFGLFQESVLCRSLFQNMVVSDTTFSLTNLEGIAFANGKLLRSAFDKCLMNLAKVQAVFEECSISESACRNAMLINSRFIKSILQDSDFFQADFSNADLQSCQLFLLNSLTELNLTGSNLQGALIYLLSDDERWVLVKERQLPFRWEETLDKAMEKNLPIEYVLDEDGDFNVVFDLTAFRKEHSELAKQGGKPSVQLNLSAVPVVKQWTMGGLNE